MSREIRKVEVTSLFWKDLADWRKHPDYWRIRSQISDMVQKAARGEPAGDKPFTGGNLWTGIRHMHLAAKLVVFTMYPDEDTIRLCAIKKHDFYGFKNERRSLASTAAQTIRYAATKGHCPSPEWSGLRWSDPAEIANHPELPELSSQGLGRLMDELMEEVDSLEKLKRKGEPLSPARRVELADRWLDSIIEAQDALHERMMHLHKLSSGLAEPALFTRWGEDPVAALSEV